MLPLLRREWLGENDVSLPFDHDDKVIKFLETAKVVGIYNATNGMLRDLGECTADTKNVWRNKLRTALGLQAPTAICLSRQKLPLMEVDETDLAMAAKGAYIVLDQRDPEMIIMATGRLCSLATSRMQSRKTLAHLVLLSASKSGGRLAAT